jgi:hypothetical protein
MDRGCICRLQTCEPAEVIRWIYDGDTPVCPHCGIAALPPALADFVELSHLHQRRFGAQAGMPPPDEEA